MEPKIKSADSIVRLYKTMLDEEEVLHFISLNPGLNIYTIAKHLKISRSHILKIINKLEGIGILKTKIVTEENRSQRKVYVRNFTEEGSVLTDKARNDLKEWIQTVDLDKAKNEWDKQS